MTLIVTGLVYAANEYTKHLVELSQETSAPDRLRELAHGMWARWDLRVQVGLARNQNLPDDLVRELSHGSYDVREKLASNPHTPLDS